MHLYCNDIIQIYFGDAQDNFFPHQYKQLADNPGYLYPSFARVCDELKIYRPIFLHQVHGTDGVIIFSQNQADRLYSFSHDGDYLITNLPGVVIGVVTADCMPIMLYDVEHQVVAAVHAGWRGAVQGVIKNAIGSMQDRFGSNPEKIKAILGPSARGCCYEVQKDFLRNLEPSLFASGLVRESGGRLFFDLPEFAREQLAQVGVVFDSIDQALSDCTICNHSYYSHRRGDAGRNMSVIVLK